jgi:hypothetical protein
MSNPLQHAVGPDEPYSHQNESVVSRPSGIPSQRLSITSERKSSAQAAAPATVADRGVVIGRFRLPRSLEPTVLPQPLLVSGYRSVIAALALLALAVAVIVAAGFIIIGKAWTSAANKSADQSSAVVTRVQGHTSGIGQRPSRPAPTLAANQAGARATGEVFPLGLSVRGPGNGALLIVGGLKDGATLSAGQPAADNNWRLSAADLSDVMIQPPPDFVGTMDLAIELRLADDTVADRTSLHFEWEAPVLPPPAPAAAPALPLAATAAPKAYEVRQLDPEEIAALLKRGDQLIASGDLAAARLVLRRAAEAEDARAALALAGTYDPIVLERRAVHGFAPNIALARTWYERAEQFGSADASRRLEMLASRRD